MARNSVSSDIIVSLLKTRDGKLWIGTYWGGLNCFDGQRFVHYRAGGTGTLANDNVWALVEDKDGKVYNFIEEMNPHTNNTEATGVVTRFTTHYEVLDQDFPIKVRLLSVADILQILCDTAYQDVKSHAIIEKEDINELL